MRVLLVSPYDPADRRFGPHKMGLGLAYIAGVLRQAGCEVEVLDKWAEFRSNGFDVESTERMLDIRLVRLRPEIVGFSSYSALIGDVIKDARRTRSLCPNARIVIGGPHATACARETLLRYPFIDLAVRGEGELAMLAIAEGRPLDEIDGIAFERGGEIVMTRPPRPCVDLDLLPRPARDLMRMDYYSLPSMDTQSRGGRRYATILSSRGCQFACSFCLQAAVHRRLALRSPDEVVAEMEEVLANYPQVDSFEFLDSLFLSDFAATERLCREIIRARLPLRIRWKAQTRASGVPRDAYKLLREAGCAVLGFGFESGSQRVLDAMNKRLTVEEIRLAAAAARDAGIAVDAYFIYGHPDEDEEDLRQTLRVMREIRPDYVGLGRYFVVPGTLDYRRLVDRGLIPFRYDDPAVDWERVNIVKDNSLENLTRMPDARFRYLERLAFWTIVEPTNLRYVLRERGVGAFLEPKFAVTAIKTLVRSLVGHGLMRASASG